MNAVPRRRTSIATLARRLAATRVAFLFVGMLVLLAQGARLSHLVFVQHAICTHGTMVHAHPGESAHAKSAPAGESSAEPRGSDDADHDHCDAATLLHRVDPDTTFVGEPSMVVVDAPDGAARAEVRAVAALALAPKNSPPPNG